MGAAGAGQNHVVRYLIDAGIYLELDHCGPLAMMYAADSGHGSTVRMLADYGVSVHHYKGWSTQYMSSPLVEASFSKHYNVANY
jgi:hypothetical protein